MLTIAVLGHNKTMTTAMTLKFKTTLQKAALFKEYTVNLDVHGFKYSKINHYTDDLPLFLTRIKNNHIISWVNKYEFICKVFKLPTLCLNRYQVIKQEQNYKDDWIKVCAFTLNCDTSLPVQKLTLPVVEEHIAQFRRATFYLGPPTIVYRLSQVSKQHF